MFVLTLFLYMITILISPGYVIIESYCGDNKNEQSSQINSFIEGNSNIFKDGQEDSNSNIRKKKNFPDVNIKPYLTEGNHAKKNDIPVRLTEYPDHQISFNNDGMFLIDGTTPREELPEQYCSLEEPEKIIKEQNNKEPQILQSIDLNCEPDNNIKVIYGDDKISKRNKSTEILQSKENCTKSINCPNEKGSVAINSVRSSMAHTTEQQKFVESQNNPCCEIQIEIVDKIEIGLSENMNNLQRNANNEEQQKEKSEIIVESHKTLEVPNNYCNTCKQVQVFFSYKFSHFVANIVKPATNVFILLITIVYGWELVSVNETNAFSLFIFWFNLVIASGFLLMALKE